MRRLPVGGVRADVAVARWLPKTAIRAHDITGPEALTHADIGERLSFALGPRIEFVDVPPDAMRKGLLGAGFPAWQADGLIEDHAHYRRGEASA